MSDHMRKNGSKGLKNVGKNHQNVVLSERSETGTEKPICPWSVRRRVNVEELRSKLSYNLTLWHIKEGNNDTPK